MLDRVNHAVPETLRRRRSRSGRSPRGSATGALRAVRESDRSRFG